MASEFKVPFFFALAYLEMDQTENMLATMTYTSAVFHRHCISLDMQRDARKMMVSEVKKLFGQITVFCFPA